MYYKVSKFSDIGKYFDIKCLTNAKSKFIWGHNIVFIITAQLRSTKPEPRFCTGSSPACCVSEICNGENLWQWSWLEIRLNILLVNQLANTIHQFIFLSIACIILVFFYNITTYDQNLYFICNMIAKKTLSSR